MNRLIIILTILVFIYLPNAVLPQGIWKYYTRADGLASDTVVTVKQDKYGAYWFASYHGGLNKLDTNGVWSTIMSDDTAEVADIVIDSLNNKWLRVIRMKEDYGDYVVKFDDSTFTYYSPTGHPEPQYEPHLSCLGKDAAGHIWCGTQDWLAYWFDGTEWHPHPVPGAEKYMSPIRQITTDRYGKLYFAHYRGISTLDHYIFDGERHWIGTMTYSIAFDRQNRMWFGCTHDKYALGMFDGQNWYGYTTADGLKENDVICVAVDSSNNIWFRYASSSGVTKFDGHTFTHFTKEDGLAHNRINRIYVDPKGYIWICTYGGICVLKDTTSSVKEECASNSQPVKFSLFQNYPNPFNKSTSISYYLTAAGKCNLSIYDITGKEVNILVNEYQQAGTHQAVWNGTNKNGQEVSSGIYIAVLNSCNFKQSIKVSLIH
jgi:ligand-binding sensor domain-containing protein